MSPFTPTPNKFYSPDTNEVYFISDIQNLRKLGDHWVGMVKSKLGYDIQVELRKKM